MRVLERIRRSDVLHHGAIVFGGVLVFNVCNFLFYMLVGRLASVEVYGEVTALAASMLLLAAPALVAQLIVARVAAELEARGDRAALRRLADAVTRWPLLAGVLVVLVAALARDPIARFLNLTDSGAIVTTAVATALLFTAYVQRGVLQGAHLFGDLSGSMALEATSRALLTVVLVVPFAATGALGATALALLLTVLYHGWRFATRFGARRAPLALDTRTLVRVTAGVGVGQLTLTVLTFYDVPIIKHAFDAHAAGLYAAAALVGRAVIAASAFIPTIVLPKATARVAAGRSPLGLFFAAVGLTLAAVALATLAGMFFPRVIVTAISGRAFGDAAPLVLTYVLASGALALATVIASYNFGLHRYTFVVPATLAAAAEVVTLALWHPTLQAAVGVLAIGHTCVLACTLYRITRPLPLVTPSSRYTRKLRCR
ncbi:MAG: hypothetical protein JO225_02945 [Candidatus Eremiobacteraeota bacterium]|nr:hypothetical protein [Candidatus Eremiobacteraeota bacterium]